MKKQKRNEFAKSTILAHTELLNKVKEFIATHIFVFEILFLNITPLNLAVPGKLNLPACLRDALSGKLCI